MDVSDGAFSSFRYDEISNELRAVGPLLPGHKYKVLFKTFKKILFSLGYN